ncbi:MAG: protein kinase [Actinobacteria bacterium]|nr:protein kinase [Actinomycetota bacterium]
MTDPRPTPSDAGGSAAGAAGPSGAPTGPVPGRQLLGRYRLVGLLARGGMAEVWEGVDEVLARPVALKMLHPHLAADEAFRERFRREAISAARLAHPNVVATFDTGEDEGTAFIVMELVRGQTVRQLLEENGPLPAAVVAAIGVQIAEALQHAHDAGLVHRDVKPANVLLCEPEPRSGDPIPRVKVADFGIARAATRDGADLTQPGALLGTAKYLAPEQVEGEPPDARSDVYALGVVLYELLTGRPPFVADSEVATAMAHLNQDPLRPRQVRAGIPRALDAVVTRAMARDPAGRYQSAADLGNALRSIDLGTDDAVPSVVRDPTPPSGLAPTFRQTERTWLVPAAVIVLLAGALTGLGVLFTRSEVGRGILQGDGRSRSAEPGTAIDGVVAHSFDPQGNDRSENEDDVGAVTDGDPNTSWSTVRYDTREFGGLKEGVGLSIELPEPTEVRRVRVSSPTTGWNARVYVAPRPGSLLADWGSPVAQQQGIRGSAEFDLDGAQGKAVLIWITRLGDNGRVEVAEVTIEG